MNILVVSQSNIVIELLKFVFKKSTIDSEHVKSVDSASDDSYNIIFIDDSTQNCRPQLQEIVDNFSYNKLVFIGKADESIDSLVDIVVKKPFLPQDINDIIDTTQSQIPKFKTKVLDEEEIARIKALMDLDDEVESKSDSFIDLLDKKESLKLKKKEAKEFLFECTKLSKKELKKLLKGAKVSIKINYKSADNE